MTDRAQNQPGDHDAALPSEDRIDSMLLAYTSGRTVGLIDIDGEPDRRFDLALLGVERG